MRRKIRIFSNIAIIALSVCMFAFGVYAASTVSVTTKGTVTFSATGVYATVSRTITGSSADDTHNTLAPVKITADVQDDDDPFSMDADLEFDSASTPIVMSFTVKNEATDRDLYFKVTDSGSTLQADDNVRKISWDLDYWVALAPEDEYTVNIKLSVADANISVTNCKYAYSFVLKNSLEEDGYYTLTKNDVTFSEGKITKFNSSVATKEKLVIPSSINDVEATQLGDGSSAISDSDLSVTEMVIPSSVLTIGDYLFDSVTPSLTKLFAPNVTIVKDSSLRACNSLEEIYLPNAETTGYTDFPNIKKLILPNVTTLGDMIWESAMRPAMETLVLTKLTTIGVIGYYASNLNYIDVSSATVIPDNCFMECVAETIILSPNITSIGESAFDFCSKIVFTKLPEKLETIGDNAFEHLSSDQLKFTEIPQSVKTIGLSAFGSYSPSSITIYNTIQSIGSYIFGTTNIITVNFKGTETEWNTLVTNGKIAADAFVEGSKIICTDSDGDPIIFGA